MWPFRSKWSKIIHFLSENDPNPLTWPSGPKPSFSRLSEMCVVSKSGKKNCDFGVSFDTPEVLWTKNVTFCWRASKAGPGAPPDAPKCSSTYSERICEVVLSNSEPIPPRSALPEPTKTAHIRHTVLPRGVWKMLKLYKYLSVLFFNFKCHTSVLPRSAEAQMLDLQRPETQLARRLRPTGGPGSARGSLGPKRGVGAASGRVSCAAHTKRSQMSEAARRFLRLFRLITSRVLVESACPSGGGRGQLKRSPFPSFMRLRDPQAQREQKGTFVFTNKLVFIM